MLNTIVESSNYKILSCPPIKKMYCRQMFLDLEKMINQDKCEDVHFSLQELDLCDEIIDLLLSLHKIN